MQEVYQKVRNLQKDPRTTWVNQKSCSISLVDFFLSKMVTQAITVFLMPDGSVKNHEVIANCLLKVDKYE